MDRRSVVDWFVLGVCAVAVVATLTVIWNPRATIFAAAALMGLYVLTKPIGRFVFVLAGALIVLQGNSSGPKLLYMVGVAVCLVAAAVRVPRAMRERTDLAAFKPLLVAAVVMVIVLAANLVRAEVGGIGVIVWFRDALPYALLVSLPFVGLDAASEVEPRTIERISIIALGVAPFAFMTDWLNRRGASALPVGRFAFASYAMSAAFAALAIGHLADRRSKRRWWFVAALLAPAALLLTGTRSSLALSGALIGAVGSTRKVRLPPVRTLAAAVTLGSILVVLVPRVGASLTSDPEFYQRRFGSLSAMFGRGDTLATDLSYRERQHQYAVAQQTFSEHPALGVGLGYDFLASGDVLAFDTPLATLAKTGIAGGIAILTFVWCWTLALRRFVRVREQSYATTAIRSFALAFAAFVPLASALEDKGLALSMCVFAALLPAARAVAPSELGSPSLPSPDAALAGAHQ